MWRPGGVRTGRMVTFTSAPSRALKMLILSVFTGVVGRRVRAEGAVRVEGVALFGAHRCRVDGVLTTLPSQPWVSRASGPARRDRLTTLSLAYCRHLGVSRPRLLGHNLAPPRARSASGAVKPTQHNPAKPEDSCDSRGSDLSARVTTRIEEVRQADILVRSLARETCRAKLLGASGL